MILSQIKLFMLVLLMKYSLQNWVLKEWIELLKLPVRQHVLSSGAVCLLAQNLKQGNLKPDELETGGTWIRGYLCWFEIQALRKSM